MKTDTAMKDSGIEWIGKIPENWKISRLKRILTLLKDGTHNPPSRIDDGVLLLSAENIRDGFIEYEKNISYISEYDYNEMQRTYQIQKNDVLLTIVGTIGRCAIVKQEVKFSVQRSVAILRPIKDVKSKFLFYLIHGNIFQNQLFIGVNKTAQGGVYLGELKNITIVMPKTQDEQINIISFLDKNTQKIDSEICKNQKLIELIQEKRQNTINQAVTKGLDLTIQMKDSGIEWIGEIPKHWSKQKITSCCELRGRIGWKGLTSNDYRDVGPILLGVSNISKKFELDLTKLTRISEEGYRESPEIIVKENDILLAKSGATTGKVCIVKQLQEPATVNAAVNIIRCIDPLNSEFVYWFLSSSKMQEALISYASTSAQPNLFQRDIKKLDVVIPPYKEQKEILHYLNKQTIKMDSLIFKIKSQIMKLQEFRQALISSAVTGKIDVRDSVA